MKETMEKVHKQSTRILQKAIKLTLFAFCFLVSKHSPSQDYIRGIPDISKVEHTIVREINSQTWLVYFYTSNQSGFIFQHEGNVSTVVIDIPSSMYINDFEILNGYLYYCGHITQSSGSQIGIIGRLNYANIIFDQTIEMCRVDYTEDVLKLDVYLCESIPRIIAAGKNTDNVGSLLDAAFTGASAIDINMAIADTVNEIFLDVAATDNMLLASSHNTSYIFSRGRQWFFSRPTLLAVNPFTYYHSSQFSHNWIVKHMLIEHTQGDSVVFATTSSIMPKICLYQYGMDVCAGTILIDNSDSIGTQEVLKDIKYNKVLNIIDILTQRQTEQNTLNNIHHISLPLSPPYALSHQYESFQLHSLEYCDYSYNKLVVTGTQNYSDILSIIHFTDAQFPVCGELVSRRTIKTSTPSDCGVKVKMLVKKESKVYKPNFKFKEYTFSIICN